MEHITSSQLWKLIDGESDETESKAINAHLHSCPLCKEEYDLLIDIEKNMRHVGSPAPEEGFALKVTGKIMDGRYAIKTPGQKIFLCVLLLSFLLCVATTLVLLGKHDESFNILKATAPVNLPASVFIMEGIGAFLILLFFDRFFLKKSLNKSL